MKAYVQWIKTYGSEPTAELLQQWVENLGEFVDMPLPVSYIEHVLLQD